MALSFLDTNVILRHLLGDDPKQSPRATVYLERVETGAVQVRLADTVIFEAVFTLERRYKQPKAKIREGVLPLLELRSVVLPGKRHFRKVFEYYADRNMDFADAYHAVLMERLKLEEIVSFDQGFDKLSTVRRREP